LLPSSPTPELRWWTPGLLRLSIDRLGILQAIGGFVLGLVALLSSYDHITVFSYIIHLQQQWGILCILASVATVVVVAEGFCAAVAELASRSLLRAAHVAAGRRSRSS
jgi:hypothetical protein